MSTHIIKLYEDHLRMIWYGVLQLQANWIMVSMPPPSHYDVVMALGMPDQILWIDE